MVAIILAGGGDAPDSKPLDELFLSLLKPKKILYLPIAWKTGDFASCKKWLLSTFSKLGFTNIEMWTDLNHKKIDDLDQFGGIYIGGGNTFSLLHDLRNSKFNKLLLQFLNSGKPVYGGSAGAIIFGKNIETARFGTDADSNDVGLRDLSGFNLINNYSIQCHYTPDQDGELVTFSKSQPVIALSERSGILVDNGKLKVIGFESAYVFKNRKKSEFKVGALIS